MSINANTLAFLSSRPGPFQVKALKRILTSEAFESIISSESVQIESGKLVVLEPLDLSYDLSIISPDADGIFRDTLACSLPECINVYLLTLTRGGTIRDEVLYVKLLWRLQNFLGFSPEGVRALRELVDFTLPRPFLEPHKAGLAQARLAVVEALVETDPVKSAQLVAFAASGAAKSSSSGQLSVSELDSISRTLATVGLADSFHLALKEVLEGERTLPMDTIRIFLGERELERGFPSEALKVLGKEGSTAAPELAGECYEVLGDLIEASHAYKAAFDAKREPKHFWLLRSAVTLAQADPAAALRILEIPNPEFSVSSALTKARCEIILDLPLSVDLFENPLFDNADKGAKGQLVRLQSDVLWSDDPQKAWDNAYAQAKELDLWDTLLEMSLLSGNARWFAVLSKEAPESSNSRKVATIFEAIEKNDFSTVETVLAVSPLLRPMAADFFSAQGLRLKAIEVLSHPASPSPPTQLANLLIQEGMLKRARKVIVDHVENNQISAFEGLELGVTLLDAWGTKTYERESKALSWCLLASADLAQAEHFRARALDLLASSRFIDGFKKTLEALLKHPQSASAAALYVDYAHAGPSVHNLINAIIIAAQRGPQEVFELRLKELLPSVSRRPRNRDFCRALFEKAREANPSHYELFQLLGK